MKLMAISVLCLFGEGGLQELTDCWDVEYMLEE